MLRKILEVFISKKFTHRKTSRTLGINVFEIQEGKNIWKLSSKYELLFLEQANSSSDSSQILMQQFPYLQPPSPFLSNFTLANWNPSSTQSSSCYSLISLFCRIPLDCATTSIRYTKPYPKPKQSNLLLNYIHIMIPYW